MSKRNLLQLCISPFESEQEYAALHLARTFEKEGYGSHSACLMDSFIERKLKEQNLKYITLQEQKRFSFANNRKFKKYIQENQIDTIFVHRLQDLWSTFWMKRKFKNLKIIFVTHGFIEKEKKDFWHRLVFKQVDKVITPTNLLKDQILQNLPVPAEKYTVIPGGVDGDKFVPQNKADPERKKIRKSLGVDKDNELLVGLIGRFDTVKGQLEFIEAIKNLKSRLPHVKYVLAGADTFRAEPLKRKILEEILLNSLETHVQLRSNTDDIPTLIKALDIFMMLSYEETFSEGLIEAMACERICISTNVGGSSEILNKGEYGLLIEPKSSKAIEEGLQEVIKNLSKYEEKAKNARKRVQQKYRSKDVLDRLKELI